MAALYVRSIMYIDGPRIPVPSTFCLCLHNISGSFITFYALSAFLLAEPVLVSLVFGEAGK